MSSYLADMFVNQFSDLPVEVWIEPFAGGAGVGLSLLDAGVIDELWLTDTNPALSAFWRTICTDGDALADRIATSAATMNLWESSRELVAASEHGEAIDTQDLAFAGFFVNRCSRSGICAPNAGPIGGRHQTGRWTIQDRYNPAALADRVRYVASLSSRIRFFDGDGIDSIAELDGSVGIEDEVMMLVDPPYLREGPRLYAHSFTTDHHQRLADTLTASPTRWVLTYDDEPSVHQRLYPTQRVLQFSIPNTANKQRIASEYAVFSELTAVDPTLLPLPRGTAQWLRWTEDPDDPATIGHQETNGHPAPSATAR